MLMGKDLTSRDRYPAANGGLFSTAPDYVALLPDAPERRLAGRRPISQAGDGPLDVHHPDRRL